MTDTKDDICELKWVFFSRISKNIHFFMVFLQFGSRHIYQGIDFS